MTDHIDNRPRS